MGRKNGDTNARKKAMVSDCMKQIAKKNIIVEWVEDLDPILDGDTIDELIRFLAGLAYKRQRNK